MAQWNYGIFADRKLTTAYYIASVQATTEPEAIARLKVELARVPMPLYIGPIEAVEPLSKAPLGSM